MAHKLDSLIAFPKGSEKFARWVDRTSERRKEDLWCNAPRPGNSFCWCTRKMGHAGFHVAHNMDDGHAFAAWSDSGVPKTLEEAEENENCLANPSAPGAVHKLRRVITIQSPIGSKIEIDFPERVGYSYKSRAVPNEVIMRHVQECQDPSANIFYEEGQPVYTESQVLELLGQLFTKEHELKVRVAQLNEETLRLKTKHDIVLSAAKEVCETAREEGVLPEDRDSPKWTREGTVLAEETYEGEDVDYWVPRFPRGTNWFFALLGTHTWKRRSREDT